MTDKEEDLQKLTGIEINEKMQKLFDESLDMNHYIIQLERNMAQDARNIKEAFEVQAERMEEIAVLHEIIARMTADRTGDLISLEFNLTEVTDDDPDDEDDDD